jgi:shikimate dehydrogenase
MISSATAIAGVVGQPVAHSLSPRIHNAWLEVAGIDAVYLAFAPPPDGLGAFLEGVRRGVILGLNVTIPFKEEALAFADDASPRAKAAGAANLLVFRAGEIFADNTDGLGLLAALAEQAPGFDVNAGPVLVLGAGGAARGAVAALIEAGAPEVRIANRTAAKAEALANTLGAQACPLSEAATFEGVTAVINATAAGLGGGPALEAPLQAAPQTAVFMDMVYKPLRTGFLATAGRRQTVDGLSMLIGQARPSFQAIFGAAPPVDVDVRRLALKALGEAA